ncbi:CBASS cGAMP-activated phospholipase [Rhodobacteraceae bacterium]|nr:CBASS cGAMP-activated phospholipase [Paracoccaceae bacterium]
MMAKDQNNADAHKMRLLCIDGGGIKGTCPAAFLASLEDDLDRPIGQYFDLIAGTSTGGILAIGLALGLSANDLLALYVDKGPEIFGQAGHPNKIAAWFVDKWASTRHIVAPKHDAERLKVVLQSVLKDQKLGQASTRLVVPSWDADLQSVYVYKTAHHQRFTKDYKKTAVDAALATAAAPSFFKRHRTVDQVGLIDGGVWANNPTGIAAVEATAVLGWPADQLQILSLGCVDEIYTLPENPGKLGLGWKGRVISLFMDGQSSGAMGIAKLITGHPHSRKAIFRYAPKAPANLFDLDDTSKIDRLKGLGSSMARKATPELKDIFFNRPAEPFHPVHSLETTP